MTKISLRKNYLPDITLYWNTFVCECKCGYSLSFPVTITALNGKVFVGYLMVAKDEGTGADLGSFSIISGGKVMCGTTVRTSSWQFQICNYAEGIINITSENACFMITVSKKNFSIGDFFFWKDIGLIHVIIFYRQETWLVKHNFKTTYHNHYNKSCLYFLHVVPDLGRYIRVNTGTYVLATGIHASLSI